ncbi:alpha/beta hydrolase family protein [Cryobacterium luteum]|uniref:Alpha/beta fold hydrolase n=1 Tax=Cryobacterium luteum TaxID=1424661 RepID=A0A1H8CU38_9MICO|nr:alpha/beta fold hydrolase [Cryobacterium luteum]TFB91782.1 alpha/beta fold hydrolase [Cryobacterium luteum]SEM98392.1 Alpha/beta hydrolase family protein [Cryobacterium luteum]
MHEPQPPNGRQPGVLRTILGVGGIVAVGSAVALVAAAGVLSAVMAKTIVTPPARREDDTRVVAVDRSGGTVTLQRHRDSVLPGEYSFFFSAGTGHVRVGEITARTTHTVTRRILKLDYGDLAAARRGRFSGWLYTGPADLGFEWSDVTVPTPIGPAPAWLIPADAAPPSTRWVIQVHGRAVRREEALRAVPVFRAAGYTSLLVSYRNDGDAPASPDGRYGLGDTEWPDVAAAIDFAAAHGARSIILMGWSMGGAVALQTLTRSPSAGLIAGIVLESPVIDWADVVAAQAVDRRLPRTIARCAVLLMGSRWGASFTGQAAPIDFGRLDFVARARDLHRPVLLLHSDDDGFVPAAGSRRLAGRRSDIVTFVAFSDARHTKLWNFDPARWNAEITAWLARLPEV